MLKIIFLQIIIKVNKTTPTEVPCFIRDYVITQIDPWYSPLSCTTNTPPDSVHLPPKSPSSSLQIIFLLTWIEAPPSSEAIPASRKPDEPQIDKCLLWLLEIQPPNPLLDQKLFWPPEVQSPSWIETLY